MQLIAYCLFLVSIEKIYQTLETVFHHISKHLEFRQRYSATRRIFNSLLGVWKCDETLSLMFDILLHTVQHIKRLTSKYSNSKSFSPSLKGPSCLTKSSTSFTSCDQSCNFPSKSLRFNSAVSILTIFSTAARKSCCLDKTSLMTPFIRLLRSEICWRRFLSSAEVDDNRRETASNLFLNFVRLVARSCEINKKRLFRAVFYDC